MEYTYEVIIEKLRIGHEIEFRYNGKMYSITSNYKLGWHFACGTTLLSPYFESVQDIISFVNNIKIEGLSIESIIEGKKYELIDVM